MTFWNDLRTDLDSIIKVDNFHSSALGLLYDNCLRMCNETNSNVEMATLSPNKWFGELVPYIITNVDYVSKSTNFMIKSYSRGELYCYSYSCGYRRFETWEDMIGFFEVNRFTVLVLFSVNKFVNLDTLVSEWVIKYSEIEIPEEIRNKKIDYIINE
jgi:hypothetical protein